LITAKMIQDNGLD